jgi:hypothetical protein
MVCVEKRGKVSSCYAPLAIIDFNQCVGGREQVWQPTKTKIDRGCFDAYVEICMLN